MKCELVLDHDGWCIIHGINYHYVIFLNNEINTLFICFCSVSEKGIPILINIFRLLRD